MPQLNLEAELNEVSPPVKTFPPKLNLEKELQSVTSPPSPPSPVAGAAKPFSGWLQNVLGQPASSPDVNKPAFGPGQSAAGYLLNTPLGRVITSRPGSMLGPEGQMTDEYRAALDQLTNVIGPLAMPMVGGEAMAEVIGRRGGQFLRGIAQRFGMSPQQVAQDVAQNVTQKAAQTVTGSTGPTLDLAKELEVVRSLPGPKVASSQLGAALRTQAAGPTALDLAARPVPPVPPFPPAAPALSGGAPGLTEPILKQSFNRRIVGAAQELFAQAEVQRIPGTKISDQITDLLGSQKLPLPQMDATLQKYGLTFTDFANGVFRPAIADAGRRLQTLSVVERQINLMAQRGGTAEDVDRLVQIARGIDANAAARPWWQRVDAIRRGLLVTQLSSVVKRTEMGIARVGLNTMQDALDSGMQHLFGLPKTSNPIEGFEALGNIAHGGNPKQLEAILSQFPLAKDRLFNEYASEIASGAGEGNLFLHGRDLAFLQAQKAVAFLNVATRAQEHLIRGSVFQATLAQRVAVAGDNLVKMIQEGRVGEIADSDIQGAIHKALETTFGAQPARGGPAEAFMRVINGIPGASLAIPFPRHLVNSLKFYFDYSPFGILKLLMPIERAAIAAGNTQAISRAVLGTAMLGGAVAFRASQFAGEKWYEGRLPDGRTVNLKPFNPFLPYLLVADMLQRQRTGTLVHPYATKDVIDAALSVNVSAGTGLLLVDWLVAGLQGEAGQKTVTRLQTLAGQTAAGLLTPLNQLSDALAQFVPSMGGLRETRTEPFWGPIKAAIPGVAQTLPLAESPTHSGGIVRQDPLLRQLTALGIYQQKNPAERELDRLQFPRFEIMPSAGDPEADRLIAKHMGPLVERALVPVVQSPGYQQLTNAQKGVVLQRILGSLRNEARFEAMRENPQLFVQLKLQRLPVRERLLLQESGVPLPPR